MIQSAGIVAAEKEVNHACMSHKEVPESRRYKSKRLIGVKIHLQRISRNEFAVGHIMQGGQFCYMFLSYPRGFMAIFVLLLKVEANTNRGGGSGGRG